MHDMVNRTIEHEGWDGVGRMALNFQVELSEDGKRAARLKKEMILVKHILYESMKKPEDAERFVNAGLFVRLHQTIERLEKELDENRMRRTEFLAFLKVLLQRLKHEKLIVYKTLERKNEFKRMKERLR